MMTILTTIRMIMTTIVTTMKTVMKVDYDIGDLVTKWFITKHLWQWVTWLLIVIPVLKFWTQAAYSTTFPRRARPASTGAGAWLSTRGRTWPRYPSGWLYRASFPTSTPTTYWAPSAPSSKAGCRARRSGVLLPPVGDTLVQRPLITGERGR